MNKYKSLGITLTPQRLAILDYLEGNREHPAAETVYRHLAERFPTLSLATVYNTLEKLKQKQLLQELGLDCTKKRYDPDTRPHHHAICLKCRKIADLEIDYQPPSLPMTDDFEIVGHVVSFFGYCTVCRRNLDGQ